MSCLLVRSEWSQILKCLSTGTTLILPLSRSAFVNLFHVALQSSCRTYHTDVVFRWYVSVRGVLIYLVE